MICASLVMASKIPILLHFTTVFLPANDGVQDKKCTNLAPGGTRCLYFLWWLTSRQIERIHKYVYHYISWSDLQKDTNLSLLKKKILCQAKNNLGKPKIFA